ncbi:MAG: aminoacyl-tRNA synthetase [Burkholderiaceae bacterium]
MRISDEQYFRSCVAKERHLAHLLGHPQIEECYETAGTLWDKAQALPQWTRDWRACGPLLAEHRLTVIFSAPALGDVQAGSQADMVTVGSTTVTLSDHPHPDRAVMVAIVKEVIRLLEHHHSATAESAAPLHPHP